MGSSAKMIFGFFMSTRAIERRCCSPPLIDCLAREQGGDLEILCGAEAAKEVMGLEDDSDFVAANGEQRIAAQAVNVFVKQIDIALFWAQEGREDMQKRALAAAAHADNAKCLALANLECKRAKKRAIEAMPKPACLQECHF